MLAMLSQQPSLSGRVESLLPVLAEAARAKHYPQYLGYLETVMKQVAGNVMVVIVRRGIELLTFGSRDHLFIIYYITLERSRVGFLELSCC